MFVAAASTSQRSDHLAAPVSTLNGIGAAAVGVVHGGP
jgi:hypothetical protein